MLDLLPREVADVNETLDTVLDLSEDTEVGDIAYGSGLLGADRIPFADVLPRVGNELLESEGHLPGLAVKRENLCLNFLTDLQEILSHAEAR